MGNSIMFGGLIVAAALGLALIAWKLWDSRQADQRYERDKRSPGAVVRDALQGHSFTVGDTVDFTEGGLRGHFSWLGAKEAWGFGSRIPRPRCGTSTGCPSRSGSVT